MLRPLLLLTALLLGSCVSVTPDDESKTDNTTSQIGPPPTMEMFVWDYSDMDQEHPAKRYLGALKRYHERLELYIRQLEDQIEDPIVDACRRFIPFPTPDIKPLPESVDLNQYTDENEAFQAFGEYTSALYDYASKLRNIYLNDVKRFNEQCDIQSGFTGSNN